MIARFASTRSLKASRAIWARPAANTETNVTSATPTISAPAVVAVRRWLAHRVQPREPAGLAETCDGRSDDPHDRLEDERRERGDRDKLRTAPTPTSAAASVPLVTSAPTTAAIASVPIP